MDDSIIELHGVGKRFGKIVALRDVSATIPSGVTGLLGPNGAGKSTLIKILLGLVRVTQGSGMVLGHRLGPARRSILEHVGYMPEDDCYVPGLAGVEAVQWAARLGRYGARESLRRAHEMLDFCGAGQERYRAMETYSTGMRQKVKFAAALIHDPQLLILDEPTSGLDPEERVSLLRRIRILAERSGKSVLLCTHILPDIEATSDYVLILAKGSVALAGSMDALRRPAEPHIEVVVRGSADALRQQANRHGVACETGPGDRLLLRGNVDELLRNVWRWADDAGVTLSRVSAAQNSLQQVFLQAIQEPSHAVA